MTDANVRTRLEDAVKMTDVLCERPRTEDTLGGVRRAGDLARLIPSRGDQEIVPWNRHPKGAPLVRPI